MQVSWASCDAAGSEPVGLTRVAIGCRMCLIEVITDKDDCSKELLEVRTRRCRCYASRAMNACWQRLAGIDIHG